MKKNIKLINLLESVQDLLFNAEEYDFDDGLGQGALQQYWDKLQTAYDDFKNNVHFVD